MGFWYILDYEPSLMASKAAACTGAQDPLAFWQMHHLLYERQGQLWSADEALYLAFAAELGLDPDAFAACMADPQVEETIRRLDQERREAGIRVRPSFDINGQIYQGALPYETFVQIFAEY